jgi:hypothetical protein
MRPLCGNDPDWNDDSTDLFAAMRQCRALNDARASLDCTEEASGRFERKWARECYNRAREHGLPQ